MSKRKCKFSAETQNKLLCFKEGASGGLQEAMSCDICSEVYEQVLRTPLVLPCGHTFCRSCLTDINKSGRLPCPTCRAEHHNLQVEALIVNYSLLNILPLCNQFECDKCTTHGDDLRYWCANCDQPLCGICLYSGHPQGHTIKLAQTFVTEKKQMLVEKINVLFKNIEGHKKELKEGFNHLDAWIKKLLCTNARLENTEVALKDLLADTKKADNITSVMSFEKAVGEFQSKVKNLSGGKEAHSGKAKDSGEAALKQKSNGKKAEAEHPEAAAAEAVKDAEACQQQQSSGQSKEESAKCLRAIMEYRDSRLLLHTLAEPVTTRLSLQVPHEVFLELGVGDRCLGRVYIRLLWRRRLAQQFLILCMGTMGLSLLGTKASEKERNIIVFRSAVDRKKQSISRPLLKDLDSGSRHSIPEATGVVVGIDRNNCIGFGICIQGQPQEAVACPSGEVMRVDASFGEVVAGLDVALAAFQHNPVKEVTITRCGLVLPGLSQ